MFRKWNRGLVAVSAMLVATAWLPSVPQASGDVVALPDMQIAPPTALPGDFNGDGMTDVALIGSWINNWTGVPVALRTGSSGFTSTFSLAHRFAQWATQTDNVRVVTGDIDSDDDTDMVMIGGSGLFTGLPVARSDGDGSFTLNEASVGQFLTWSRQPGMRVMSGDFNGDERMDLTLVGGTIMPTIPIAFSNGDGTFTTPNCRAADFTLAAKANGARIFTGDFDADGRTDLIVVPPTNEMFPNHNLTLALSNGDCNFREITIPLRDFVEATSERTVTVADFNGDGHTDVAVVLDDRILIAYAVGTNGQLDVYRAGATPDFLDRLQDGDLISGDFTCDGRTDLAILPEDMSPWDTIPVAMATTDPEVFTFMNDPLPLFIQRSHQSGAQLLHGDFDGDGCDDLALTGGAGWSTIPTAMSNGDGSFSDANPAAPDFASWATGTATPLPPLPPVKPLPPAPATTLGNLAFPDANAVSGAMSSAAIGTDGLPIISYYAEGPKDLRVAHCADQLCTAVTSTDIDTAGDVGTNPTIRIGSDGLPLIAYTATKNASNQDIAEVKVAHCNNIACTSATKTTVILVPPSGIPEAKTTDLPALTIGPDGLGQVFHLAASIAGLKTLWTAHCDNLACTAMTRSQVSPTGLIGPSGNDEHPRYNRPGVATADNGLSTIAHFSGSSLHELDVRACTNPDCTTHLESSGDRPVNPNAGGRVGGYSAVAIGLDGLALISYLAVTNGVRELRVAHCSDVLCTQSTHTTVDTVAAMNTSITIGGDGLGVISYHDGTNKDLKVAHCVNITCSSATTTNVDAFGDNGLHSSVTTGTDGLPTISYQGDGLNGPTLRVVHCGSPDCTAPIIAPF